MTSPTPSTSLATLRSDLAAFVQWDDRANAAGYIADRVLPVIDVPLAGDSFPKIEAEDLAKAHDVFRAPGGAYNLVDLRFTMDSYATQDYGIALPLDDNYKRRYVNLIDAEAAVIRKIVGILQRARELRAAATLFNTTVWTGATLTTAVSNEWDDKSQATPIADVAAAQRAVFNLTGMWPKQLVCSYSVFKNLRKCEEITDAIASAGAGDSIVQNRISAQMVADALGIDELIVGGAGYDAAKEGQTRNMSEVWSDEYAMVGIFAKTQSFDEICVGRTMHWTEDGSTIGGTIEEYRDENIRGSKYRIRHQVGEKLLYPQCAHLLSNITTHA